MDRLLTMPEVAEMTRCSIDTLRYYRARGIGPECGRLGRRVMYRKSSVIAWIEEQMAAGRPRTAV